MEINSALAWEKTVEWNFVRNYLGKYDFGAPIDGDRELSDALLVKSARWQLVEFKFTKNECRDERHKFPCTSKNRTGQILKEALRNSTEEIKKSVKKVIKKADQTNWSAEGRIWDYCVAQEKMASEFPTNRLEDAKSSLENLISIYCQQPISTDTLEPHFFVYSNGKNFNSLLAYPYWTEWIGEKFKPVRVCNEFKANLLERLGADNDTFNSYILELANARGYDLQDGSDDKSGGCIVLGNLTGTAGSKGVARTLNQYLKTLNNPKPLNQLKTSSSPKTPGSNF